MRKADITADLVTRLIAEQFPQWAGLEVRTVALDGVDNPTFRLGDSMSVRLPSADCYAEQPDKEHRWLPWLAPQLPLPIPSPIAQGVPGSGFPRPWSMYRWIDGQPASADDIADRRRFAADLAAFLLALCRRIRRTVPIPVSTTSIVAARSRSTTTRPGGPSRRCATGSTAGLRCGCGMPRSTLADRRGLVPR